MTLHLNLPGTSHRNSTEQQHEVREARRLLRERIRNDWHYENLPAWRSSGRTTTGDGETEQEKVSPEDRVAGFRFLTPATNPNEGRISDGKGKALGLDFDPLDWKERAYSSGDEDVTTEAESGAAATASAKKSVNGSTYKFDNPDSVGVQLSDRRLAKKRKRNNALRDEMEWNDGLAHWIQRRDAWCCARPAAQVRLLEENSSKPDADVPISPTSPSISATSSPRTSTSSAIVAQPEADSTPASSPSTTPDLTAIRNAETPTASPSLEVLVPIAPPLLPDHPVRKRISPNMYPEIYTKIILQSRTPSVPINLRTLVQALVQGWKDDGEWPPKNAPLEKSIGRKKGSGPGAIRDGVRAVGRVLRLTGVGENASKTQNI